MGQEFCKGCEDCTNFKNNEDNLSYLANKPIRNINNPYLINGNLDNSILNKTDFQNDTSILTNNNNNNNPNKNETLQISSLNSKRNNNDQNLLINTKYYQRESEDIFKQKNEDEEEENNNNENIILNDNNFNDYNIFNNNEEDEDFVRLKEIQKNNNSKKITKLFKELKIKKEESHKVLYTEYSTIDDNNYFENINKNELDVNLAPEQNCLYIGTKFNYKKDGLGLEKFSESNSKYFGRFINGKRMSMCRFIVNNNNDSYYYYGEVKGLYAYGFGWSENFKESVYYEGMWTNSFKEGYGIEKYNKDNSIYKGCFSKGRKMELGNIYGMIIQII